MINWRDPDGRPERKVTAFSALRWGTAVTFVVAAHGGAAWVALNWKPAVAEGEPPPAVMIELAQLAVAPEAPQQDVAPGPQMTEAQTEPVPEVPDKPVEQEPVEKPPEMPNAEAVPTPPPPKSPEPVKEPTPEVKPVEKKKPVERKKTRAPRTTALPTSQARRADRAAAPFASSSLDNAMSPASWRGSLVAHLNRHKRFPSGAAGAGVATVAFIIDRSGRVVSSRLVRSSGDSVLDAEAVSLPRRASPVPAPPPNVGGSSLSLTVPIRFNR